MNVWLLLCGFCLAWIFYAYFGYPMLLLFLAALRRYKTPAGLPDEQLPSFRMLIPAYNEEAVLAHKLETALALDYPPGKFCITVVSDRSTDDTDRIARSFLSANSNLRFIRNEDQKGKIRTISDLGATVSEDILLITDANAIFARDALRRLAAYFADPQVGIVNGNRTLKASQSMAGLGEALYWRYETALKQAESRITSNAFIQGAMTAIRSELFTPIPGELEFDHVLPLHVVNQGKRVVFAGDAHFSEDTAPDSAAEWKVRVRNAVRGFTMVREMGQWIDIRRHTGFVFHVWSRKVLRWLVGLPAIGLFVFSAPMLGMPLLRWIFLMQAAFYLVVLCGWLAETHGVRLKLAVIPYYFCLVNAATLVGFFRAMRGQRMATWGTTRAAEQPKDPILAGTETHTKHP